MKRRDFLAGSVATGTYAVAQRQAAGQTSPSLSEARKPQTESNRANLARPLNGPYQGDHLSQIAFPMGGIGAGMICLEGTGSLAKFSLRNRPDLVTERKVFAAISITSPRRIVRVLEGPVPTWKLRPQFPGNEWDQPFGTFWNLPRCHSAQFEARFPFATVRCPFQCPDPERPASSRSNPTSDPHSAHTFNGPYFYCVNNIHVVLRPDFPQHGH